MRTRMAVLAAAATLPLALAACSGDDDAASTSTSKTTTTTSSHAATTSAPHQQGSEGRNNDSVTEPVPAPAPHQNPQGQQGQQGQQSHQNPQGQQGQQGQQGHQNPQGGTPPAAPGNGGTHDDDPGGHPCTDQSGAPGHYIADDSGSWVCEITGNAPRQ